MTADSGKVSGDSTANTSDTAARSRGQSSTFVVDHAALQGVGLVLPPKFKMPVPVVVIPSEQPWRKWGGGPENWEFHQALAALIDRAVYEPNIIRESPLHLLMRGTRLDNLPRVLATGVDVTPTDSVIWVADDPQKCLEYGPLLLLYDRWLLDNTFREVDASIDVAELDRLRQTFPTLVRSRDGTKFWLSRLPEDDRRVGSDYEWGYGRWIPGDALQALRGVVAVGPPAKVAELLQEYEALTTPTPGPEAPQHPTSARSPHAQ